MAVEFPSHEMVALQDMAAHLHAARRSGTALDHLARDLLLGFFDVCTYAGLDRVLDELGRELAIDATDRAALADHPTVPAALVSQIQAIDLDGGGPRQAKPRQLAECIVAALGLTLADETDRAIELPDDVRAGIASAITEVVNPAFAAQPMREAIVADVRSRLPESAHPAFAKVEPQLDERGLHITRTPKIPIDTLHAIQRALAEARDAFVERVASAALDRAKDAIARADANAAERLDQPITLRTTPRQAAILRAQDPRVGKTATAIVHSLVESVPTLARFRWRAAEKPVVPYAASRTFVVGELVEHPKFGRGEVVTVSAQRIDVEFEGGKHTLVHALKRT